MKKLILGILILAAGSSCQISKRHYTRGFQIEWRTGKMSSSKITMNKKVEADIVNREFDRNQSIPIPSMFTLKNDQALIPMIVNGKSGPQILEAQIAQLESISKKEFPLLGHHVKHSIQDRTTFIPHQNTNQTANQKGKGSGTMTLAILSLIFAIAGFILLISEVFMYGTGTVSLLLAIFAVARYDKHERGWGLALLMLFISFGLIVAWWAIVSAMFPR
jgi:hypothetical protein